MAYRLAVERDDRVQRFLLTEGDNLVGSAGECAVRIAHPTVSRRQAVLRVEDDRVEVEDLGSRNGTRVDGGPVTGRVGLEAGARLRLGGVLATLERVDDAELEPAVPVASTLAGGPPQDQSGAHRIGDTLVDSPGEVFVRDHLAPLLQRVASGGSPAAVAQAAGTALAEVLHATVVEIATRDDDDTGVMFRTGRPAGGVEASWNADGIAVRIEAPGVTPARLEPLLEAAALLVAVSRRRAGSPAATTATAEGREARPPDPPTVEPAVRALYTDAARIAPSEVSVLIRGESGTGKEVLARYLHAASDRANGPFEALNCAALPRDLLEAELFGIERGVATGVEERPGRFEAAHGGTLFLDEIGDMAPETQATILRVLQEKQVYRVGGRRGRPADVRIVAATNRDLDRMMADGSFRSDLFHRIADWVVRLPPLRERPGDIPNLAAWFLAREADRRGVRTRGLSRAAVEALLDHDWPGNIRQLEREMGRVALFLDDGDVVETRHLSDEVRASRVEDRSGGLKRALEAAERREIRRALLAADGDVPTAAAALGIGRSTMYRRMKELGVE